MLPDGYTMQWLRGPEPLQAKQPFAFRFRLLDPDGHAACDMQLYMGMLGHAAFVKTDGSTFAHIHPTGSVAMVAFMMAQKQNNLVAGLDMSSAEVKGVDMPWMNMRQENLPNEVTFPYGFPRPGRYRIFVQMKRADKVETGVFDAEVY
jgi:hypothetical protein